MALRQATAERGGSRGATAGTDRAGCGPIVEVPRCFLSTLKARFVSSAQTGLETALLTGRPHRGMGSRQRLRMSITGSSSIRRLKDCPVVVDLHELSPVGGWPAGGRHGRRLERFAQVCQDLPDRPRIRDERDEPDVATTPRVRTTVRGIVAWVCGSITWPWGRFR